MSFMSLTNTGRRSKMEDFLTIYVRLSPWKYVASTPQMRQLKLCHIKGYTIILSRGIDRLGLLSELSEALAHHGCNIVMADVWTHKHHAAAIVYVTDEFTGREIKDNKKISRIKKDLQLLIKPLVKLRSPSPGLLPKNGRLDQIKIADKVIEEIPSDDGRNSRAYVTVTNYQHRDYTLLVIKSNDRVKLLLDTISALMVMQYVVFHGTVTMGKTGTYQEYYIRRIDGCPISTMGERDRLREVLEEAINSPDSEEQIGENKLRVKKKPGCSPLLLQRKTKVAFDKV